MYPCRLFMLLPVVFLVTSPIRVRAEFFTLGFLPGASQSIAEGVSADGSVVVGHAANGVTGEFRAFRWTAAGGMQDLGNLPGDRTAIAYSVSADGSVVVGASISQSFSHRAFRWTEAGGLQDLGGSPSRVARGVSGDGSVVVGSDRTEAFRWTAAGGFQLLGVLPGIGGSTALAASFDGSVIVGSSGGRPVRWTAAGVESLGLLPGGTNGTAFDVSADGSMVVGFNATGTFDQAFRWTEAGGLQSLPGRQASAVSPDGNVVALVRGGVGTPARAFIWDGATGEAYDLRELLLSQGFDIGDWVFAGANAISGDAVSGYHIVGFGSATLGGRTEAFLVTGVRFSGAVVPAPSAFVLAALGSVLLGTVGYRRRRTGTRG